MNRWNRVACWCIFVFITLVGEHPQRECVAQTVPQPLRECDVNAFVSHLRLSAAQQQAVQMLFREYEASIWASLGDQIKQLASQREFYINCRQRPEQSAGQAIVELHEALVERIEAVREELDRNGQVFIAKLSEIVTDEQLLLLGRVLHGIERSLWRRGPISIRERHVDVIGLLEEMQLTDGECPSCEQVIGEFESTYAIALRRVGRAEDVAEGLLAQAADVRRLTGHDASTATGDIRDLDSLYREWGEIVLPPSEALVRLNRAMLNRLMSVLPEQRAREIRSRFDRAAYPEIHPDPLEMGGLFDSAAKSANLSSEQQTALDSLRNQYEAEHRKLSEEMQQSLYRAGIDWVKRTPESIASCEARIEKLLALGMRREQLNLVQIQKVIGVVPQIQAQWSSPAVTEIPQRPWDWGRVTFDPSLRARANEEEQATSGAVRQDVGESKE